MFVLLQLICYVLSLAEVNGKNVPSKEKEDNNGQYEEVDAVQEAMGGFGKWQVLVCLAISLVKFPVAWHQLAIVFMAPQSQKYNCTSPFHTNNKDQCVLDVNGTKLECQAWEFDGSIFPETIISQVCI